MKWQAIAQPILFFAGIIWFSYELVLTPPPVDLSVAAMCSACLAATKVVEIKFPKRGNGE